MSQSSQIRDVVRKAGFPMHVDQIAEQLPAITRSNISAICSGMKKAGVFNACVEDQRVAYSMVPDGASMPLVPDPPEQPVPESVVTDESGVSEAAAKAATVNITNLPPATLQATEALLRGRELEEPAPPQQEPPPQRDQATATTVIQIAVEQSPGRKVPSKREYRNPAHASAYGNGQQAKRRGRVRVAPYDSASPTSAHFAAAWLAGYDSTEVDPDIRELQEKRTSLPTAPAPARFEPPLGRFEMPPEEIVPDDASALLRQLVAAVLGSWPGQVPENVRVLVRSAITTVF